MSIHKSILLYYKRGEIMAKNELLLPLTFMIFLASVILVSFPITESARGYVDSDLTPTPSAGFNVTVTVQGNNAPNITSITPYVSPVTLTAAGTKTTYILFNVTDIQGAGTILQATAYVNLTKSGTTITSGVGCQEYAAWSTASQKGINCTVQLPYYTSSGYWNISAYIEDNQGASDAEINGSVVQIDPLYSFRIMKNSINFTGGAVTTINASNNPQILNNTGNTAFTKINITATGLSDGAGHSIGPGNFTINVTDAVGTALSSTITIPSATLPVQGTENLYLYLNVPGVVNGVYNSSAPWTIEAWN